MAILEVCVDSRQSLVAAVRGGADRVEICDRLALGGISPGLELIEAARGCGLPVMVMIRPRAGDFVWTKSELAQCVDEISRARSVGFDGVVIGAALNTGALDVVALEVMLGEAGPLDVTLHRVVDSTPDPVQAARVAQHLGIHRILSSGGAKTASDGLHVLEAMCAAAPEVSVMPGAGVTSENIRQIIDRLNVGEIHGSFSVNGETDKALVQAAKTQISRIQHL